ncbi:MAG TPA: hypothetical protein VF131_08625 [Blastocatellia bacterium]|nr:hypothetical protein [Blastocatellia bacterium]
MSILLLLAWAVGLGAFIIFIMVLIKQFQNAGPVHGIIGIITCGIWTFIWGWMNASKLGIKNLMLTWTALWILYFVLFFAAGGMAIMSGGDYGPVTVPR